MPPDPVARAILPLAATLPETVRDVAFVSEKSPLATVTLPKAPIVFVLFVRLTVPVTPDPLCRMLLAEIVPAPVCATPPPVADRSTVGALRIWPVPSPIPPAPAARPIAVDAPMLPVTATVPELIETVPAPVSGPATPTLPVLTSEKFPEPMAILPIDPIAFAVPDSVPPWPNPAADWSVPAMIVLEAACVTLLLTALRSTIAPDCPTTALPANAS